MAFDPNKGSIVETDASMAALAAIISQIQVDSHKHPVAFLSRKLNKAERAYVTHDQELLTIVQAFKTWRHYLEGPIVTTVVLTDHNNLRPLLTTKALTQRQVYWAEFLSQFDFKIKYRGGKRNLADAPSQRADYESDEPYTLLPFFSLALTHIKEGRLATLEACLTLQTQQEEDQQEQTPKEDQEHQDAAPLLSMTIIEDI